MSQLDPDQPRRPSLVARLAAMRFFSFSLMLHVVLVMLAGSVVLFRRVLAPPDFEAGSGELISSEVTPEPPAESSAQSAPQFQQVTPTVAVPLSAITTTAALNPTFTLNATPNLVRLDGKLANLPAIAGAGGGLGNKIAGLGSGTMGGAGRFFGMHKTEKSTGLLGSFFDAKQNREHKPTGVDVNQFGEIVTKFVEGGWHEGELHNCWKAPATLATTQIFIPNMSADEGPKAFEVEKEVQPSRWLVHYHGKVSPPKSGTYRFVGAGDDYLVVRFNGKLVLDHGFYQATKWQAEKYYDYGFTKVPRGFARGDRFRAEAGQYYEMDALISERPGGLVFFCLLIEDENEQYEKDAKGNPILPVFRLADLPMPELKAGQTFPPYLPNGPVWRTEPPSPFSASR